MIPYPDALLGAVIAIEGITDAKAVIHGSGGCRKNLACYSRKSFLRTCSRSAGTGSYYSQTDRIPFSNLFPEDITTGTCGKMRHLMKTVDENSELLFIIQSPCASLSGDYLNGVCGTGMKNRVHILDVPEFSDPLSRGFDNALTGAVKFISPPKVPKKDKTVNILGMSLLNKGWENSKAEIRELLSLIGIDVISFPAAGSSSEEIYKSSEASLNVALAPEYCTELKEYYRDEFELECIDASMPVGFQGMRSLICMIAEHFGTDPEPAENLIAKSEQRAYKLLKSARPFRPVRGRTFAAEGDISLVTPLVKWLYSSLSLIPVSIRLYPGAGSSQIQELKTFLKSAGCCDALDGADVYTDLFFSDGITAMLRQETGKCGCGISISLPQPQTDFLPVSLTGSLGSMYLLNSIINGL